MPCARHFGSERRQARLVEARVGYAEVYPIFIADQPPAPLGLSHIRKLELNDNAPRRELVRINAPSNVLEQEYDDRIYKE